jgi:hypothetical protein
MSRAHAVAPSEGAETSYRGSDRPVGPPARRAARHALTTSESFYLERALLLWPRLDRAKIRRVADDPGRIAEIVERRTSQPYAAILAMLTRQSAMPVPAPAEPRDFDQGRKEGLRVGLRIVRSDEGTTIQVQDLVPA